MRCKSCGLEMRLRRYDAETESYFFSCRNNQCPQYGMIKTLSEKEVEKAEKGEGVA